MMDVRTKRDIADLQHEVRRLRTELAKVPSRWPLNAMIRFWLLEVTGSAEFASNENRFKYAHREVELLADGSHQVKTNGITGTTTLNYALSIAELTNGNSSQYLSDVDTNSSLYTGADLRLVPFGGGGTSKTHKMDRVGLAWWQQTADGDPQIMFIPGQNIHDGECS